MSAGGERPVGAGSGDADAHGETRGQTLGPADGQGRTWLAGRRFYLLAAVVCLLIAGVVSLLASSQPDGLERVAEDTGFASSAQDSATSGSPLADYRIATGDADGSPLGTAAAGIVGVAITGAVAFGVFALVARRTPTADASPLPADASTSPASPSTSPADASPSRADQST
mgnify:FL=1